MGKGSMWAMAALVVGITSISCDRDRKPIQLPPLAEGPFEPRLKEGWRVHSVSYEGTMPNPFDTTTTAQFNGEARAVSGEFTFTDRNDSALVDYRIDFIADLLVGMVPVHYAKQGDGIWRYDSTVKTLWFYDFPDTLEFVVDYDADTLQLWHSTVLIDYPDMNIVLPTRMDIELRK
ncbi:MAG: hypothetical protein QNK62_04640 [Cryomorphaceae bacterium]|jgi:hypothetical protein|nr:hypothetical protein [Cryomorphaceae bacterium]|tara:strand:- start:3983 stop:4510 length:528 start_codon:yes stop_codon:yes gene_type:complete